MTPEKNDYSSWTREQLVSRIKELEASMNGLSIQNSGRPQRSADLDFSKYAARHIALKVAYFDWDSSGDRGANATALPVVGVELLKALYRARLIPQNTKACSLAMCGRTDKGVSAFSQVFSVWVRTNSSVGTPGTIPWINLLRDPDTYVAKKLLKDGRYDTGEKRAVDISTNEPFDTYNDITSELPYLGLINKFLPRNIYVWAWCPVSTSFSARYTCFSRQYCYLFPGGSLDLAKMHEACKAFMGEHNFVNYCKVDPRKPNKLLTRIILRSDILAMKPGDNRTLDLEENFVPIDNYIDKSGLAKNHSQIFAFFVRSRGFLWNQVRRMMYMLFMIGMDLMPVSIIDDTLKEKRSRSLSFAQSYNSPPYPLIFMGGSYPEFVELRWNYLASDKSEPNDLIHIEKYLMRKLESLHCEQLLKSLQLGMLYSHIRILVPDRSLLNQKLPKKVAARGSCLIPIK